MKLPDSRPFPHDKLVQADDLEAFKAAFESSGVKDLPSWLTTEKYETFSWSPLHFVVGNNALKIMDWILEDMASSQQGGDDKDLRNAYVKLFTTKSSDAEIPLHLAAQQGLVDMTRRLLTVMEDQFPGQIGRLQCASKNSEGSTPLMVAVEHVGDKPMEQVEQMLELLILKGGSNPKLKDSSGMDAFSTAKILTNRGEELEKVLRKLAPKA